MNKNQQKAIDEKIEMLNKKIKALINDIAYHKKIVVAYETHIESCELDISKMTKEILELEK